MFVTADMISSTSTAFRRSSLTVLVYSKRVCKLCVHHVVRKQICTIHVNVDLWSKSLQTASQIAVGRQSDVRIGIGVGVGLMYLPISWSETYHGSRYANINGHMDLKSLCMFVRAPYNQKSAHSIITQCRLKVSNEKQLDKWSW